MLLMVMWIGVSLMIAAIWGWVRYYLSNRRLEEFIKRYEDEKKELQERLEKVERIGEIYRKEVINVQQQARAELTQQSNRIDEVENQLHNSYGNGVEDGYLLATNGYSVRRQDDALYIFNDAGVPTGFVSNNQIINWNITFRQ